MKILVRYAIIVLSLLLAVRFVPGITIEETEAWIAVGVMAAILGVVNTFLRPILQFLSCGCIAASLGLFLLVINAFTLWFSSYLALNLFGIGFIVDGFWPAFWGGLLVSVVSLVLSILLKDQDD